MLKFKSFKLGFTEHYKLYCFLNRIFNGSIHLCSVQGILKSNAFLFILFVEFLKVL